mmetsp:Transcript_12956/g.17052  ORF Transcript_12956/g.17052 Transcript_12956/m.17052 type:complete len:204 (-) Transcript_12956:175-786(-)
MPVMNEITSYFEEKGFQPSEIPKAFAIYEFLGLSLLISTWTFCYYIQPTQTSIFQPCLRTVQKSENVFIASVRGTYHQTLSMLEGKMDTSRFFHFIPAVRSGNAKRVITSLAESTVFRKTAKPITIPGKMWLTWNILSMFRGDEQQKQTTANNSEGTMIVCRPIFRARCSSVVGVEGRTQLAQSPLTLLYSKFQSFLPPTCSS